jgi:hypothetical protein
MRRNISFLIFILRDLIWKFINKNFFSHPNSSLFSKGRTKSLPLPKLSSFSMACQKATLDLKRKDVVLVKPSKSTPSCILSLSTLDNKVSNNNICQTVHVYPSSTILDNSDSNFNSCHDFKEALSKALFYYYPLAGRLFYYYSHKIQC